jgi:hypothetical protein
MGWNLKTWLVGTVAICFLFVWDEKVLINKLFKHGDTGDGSEITADLVEKRVRKYREIRLVCGSVGAFALLTYAFFVYA